MKTRIHVNQHNIKANRKRLAGLAEMMATADAIYEVDPTSDLLPVITVKDYKQNRKGFEANVMNNGEVVCKVVYSPDKPLACGAVVWIETENPVEVV